MTFQRLFLEKDLPNGKNDGKIDAKTTSGVQIEGAGQALGNGTAGKMGKII